MVRIFAIGILMIAALLPELGFAGDEPGNTPSCPYGTNCPGQGDPLPPPPPTDPVPPGPGIGLCSGLYRGYYYNDPAPVEFQIEEAGQWGELHVTAWWRGGMWYGQGLCREIGPDQASIEIYFPNAPVHRGTIRENGYCAEMVGRIDYGNYFRLQRDR